MGSWLSNFVWQRNFPSSGKRCTRGSVPVERPASLGGGCFVWVLLPHLSPPPPKTPEPRCRRGFGVTCRNTNIDIHWFGPKRSYTQKVRWNCDDRGPLRGRLLPELASPSQTIAHVAGETEHSWVRITVNSFGLPRQSSDKMYKN